ncbi:WhiB family transcriptional regulator [Microbacterium sp. SORGH_AS_0888]|uniref:WhiB family transcriptional regulator n=1 Tax=Microbacterium sp. SORGH_AS_0888 TaxID=3041791 RepID=UPI002782B357|nr:WhiB family transcriptional regulator [Microbacterium sp. SORGH_AS_0888]MDQ1128284.1 hypothetical protein [Microbacterium sp. SORGH_AS_0888]
MIGLTTKGARELRELHDALRTSSAACDGDERFIADHDELEHDEATALRRICLGCDLFDLCRAYAVKARPTGGVWAGRRYGGRPARKQSATGGAPGGPGVNEGPRAVSEPLPTIETAANGHTAERTSA